MFSEKSSIQFDKNWEPSVMISKQSGLCNLNSWLPCTPRCMSLLILRYSGFHKPYIWGHVTISTPQPSETHIFQ